MYQPDRMLSLISLCSLVEESLGPLLFIEQTGKTVTSHHCVHRPYPAVLNIESEHFVFMIVNILFL